MTFEELADQILKLLPNAVFGQENTTGEILIATGLVELNDKLVDLDDAQPLAPLGLALIYNYLFNCFFGITNARKFFPKILDFVSGSGYNELSNPKEQNAIL